MRILGIDPGTGRMGFGVIEVARGNRPVMIDGGVIETPAHTPVPERLEDIFANLTEIIEQTHPDEMSIEKLFFSKNITTAISVAEARGVALLCAQRAGLAIYEYTPNQIKQTLTGYGNAEKKQMQEMVRRELSLDKVPQPDDAADALAAALTHYFMTKNDPKYQENQIENL